MPPRGLARVDLHSRASNNYSSLGRCGGLLEEMGRRIADGAGPGHEVLTEVGPNRVRVEVRTDTFDAMRAEATQRTLT